MAYGLQPVLQSRLDTVRYLLICSGSRKKKLSAPASGQKVFNKYIQQFFLRLGCCCKNLNFWDTSRSWNRRNFKIPEKKLAKNSQKRDQLHPNHFPKVRLRKKYTGLMGLILNTLKNFYNWSNIPVRGMKSLRSYRYFVLNDPLLTWPT